MLIWSVVCWMLSDFNILNMEIEDVHFFAAKIMQNSLVWGLDMFSSSSSSSIDLSGGGMMFFLFPNTIARNFCH